MQRNLIACWHFKLEIMVCRPPPCHPSWPVGVSHAGCWFADERDAAILEGGPNKQAGNS